MNPQLILCLIAIVLAAASYLWPHTLGASVVILSAAIIMGISKT